MAERILGPDATLGDWVAHRGLPADTTLSQLIEHERIQARLAGTFDAMRSRPGVLQCVICLYVPCEPPSRPVEEGDPPHDGLAVTVVGGAAVCECHANAVMPDDIAWMIRKLGEQARERDAAQRRERDARNLNNDKEGRCATLV